MNDDIFDNGGVFDGTVGWVGEEEHFDTEGGEVSLVNVTLFIGRNVEVDGALPDDGLAHGHRIRCRTSGPLHDVPPKGAAVHVSIPKGRWKDQGAGLIIGWATPSKLYADETQFVRVNRETGEITIFTTDDGTPDGKSIFARVKRTDGGGFEMIMPHGRLTYDGRGFHVSHSSGVSFDMGPVGGLPSALGAAIAAITCPGILKLEASAVAIGTSTGVQEPVAKATTLLTLLSSLAALLGAIVASNSALNVLGAVVDPDPVSKPVAVTGSAIALTALTTAFSSFTTALAACTTTLPALSTSTT